MKCAFLNVIYVNLSTDKNHTQESHRQQTKPEICDIRVAILEKNAPTKWYSDQDSESGSTIPKLKRCYGKIFSSREDNRYYNHSLDHISIDIKITNLLRLFFVVVDDGSVPVAVSYIFNYLYAAIQIQRLRCGRMSISNTRTAVTKEYFAFFQVLYLHYR